MTKTTNPSSSSVPAFSSADTSQSPVDFSLLSATQHSTMAGIRSQAAHSYLRREFLDILFIAPRPYLFVDPYLHRQYHHDRSFQWQALYSVCLAGGALRHLLCLHPNVVREPWSYLQQTIVSRHERLQSNWTSCNPGAESKAKERDWCL